MIVYNLYEYIHDELPLLSFTVNGFSKDSPYECITIKQSGGEEEHNHDRSDYMIQVLSRAKTTVKAGYNIQQVYDLLKNIFNLELPSATVDSIVYPAIQTYQISPIQKPGYIGADDNNLEMWSYNLKITTL